MPTATPVCWPAIIRYAGETDLTCVTDSEEWQFDPDLHHWDRGDDDRLIDCMGQVFSFSKRSTSPDGRVGFTPTGERLSLEEVTSILAQDSDKDDAKQMFAEALRNRARRESA